MPHALPKRVLRWFAEGGNRSVRGYDDDRASTDFDEDVEDDGYSVREDTFTAMVFSHLAYLPTPLFWRMIGEACVPRLPTNLGEIESVLFWPQWTSLGRVEPDCFVRFKRGDLIIEAKRRDGIDSHKPSQLAREIQSWSQLSIDDRADQVLLLAVGGFSAITDESVRNLRNRVQKQLAALGAKVTEIPLFAMRWDSLRKAIAKAADSPGRTGCEKLLLGYLASAFDSHAVVWKPPVWFSSFALEIRALTPLELRSIDFLLPRRRNAA